MREKASWAAQKNLLASAGEADYVGSVPGSGGSRRRRCQPTPAFLPRESHGQRSLVGYSLKSHKKLDMMEHIHTHTHTHTHEVYENTGEEGEDYGFGPSPGHTYKS